MDYNEYMSKTQICAERMKKLRQERGLTMEELADELEISPCSVYYYEHCKHIPNIIMLIKYSQYFGTPTDYLLGLNAQTVENAHVSMNQLKAGTEEK